MLAQLDGDFAEEGSGRARAVDLARAAVLAGDAGRAAAIMAGNTPPMAPILPTSQSRPVVQGHGGLVGLVRDMVAGAADLDNLIMGQPRLEQTAVPIHPLRQAHLVRASGCELVAVRWSAGSTTARFAHQERMAGVLHAACASAPLLVVAHDEYAVVETCDGAGPWVFAPNLGGTLEDRLRADEFEPGQRRLVIESLTELRKAMVSRGTIWQGFAPRNMFLRDGRIVLIDFEEVVEAAVDPARAAECLQWHRVFFADCLSPAESQRVFSPPDAEPTMPEDGTRVADAFERALLGVDTVTWRQRRELLVASAALEGRHRRPNAERDGGVLFGHELGHYWGDFVDVHDEVRIFANLAKLDSSERLVACLEAFEAAMEADICRALRQLALGEAEAGSIRTAALVDLLDWAGPTHIAEARNGIRDWYSQLAADPARLVDELLHAAGTEINGLDRTRLDTYLVGSADARKGHEESLATTVRVGLDFMHREDSFLQYRDPEDLRSIIGRPLPYDGTDLETVLGKVENEVARFAVSQSSTGYLAFPDSGNSVAALAGSVLTPLLNQNMIAVDRSAPSATFVEIQVVEWLRELVGYRTAPLSELRGIRDVAGLWSTGGHLSNHLAMLTALGQRFPDVRRHGLPGLTTRPAVIMAGPIAHYSHSDAAFHLGLGWEAVINVGAASNYTTDPAAVESALTDPPDGKTPFMVVGVAGNCRTTGLDDLIALADICRRHGVWFHVDACHGGSMIFSDRLRQRYLQGIEEADSVSLDPHKGLFTPYPSSYVVFRERGNLTQFSRHESAVLADGVWDLGLITPFLGSRGFESLATWMLFHHIGLRQLGHLVEARQAHIRFLERRLDETGLFVRLNDVDFYRLAFVFCPPPVRRAVRRLPPANRRQAAEVVSRYTSRLNTALYHVGEVCFDEHTLADLADRVGAGREVSYTIMAACPGNPLLTRADLDRAVDRLVEAARPLVSGMLADLSDGAGQDSRQPSPTGPAGWNDVP